MTNEQSKKIVMQRPGIIKPKKAKLLKYPTIDSDNNDEHEMEGFNPEGAMIEDMEDISLLDSWNSRELHEIIMRDEFYED